MKQIISSLLEKELKGKLKREEIEKMIEIPLSSELGDYAFPCFKLSNVLKKNPNQIAQEIEKKLKIPKEIEKIQVQGAYLNFFVNKKILAEKIISKILKEKEDFGKANEGKKIMIEYETPNTNKPLHVGHLRNGAIGMSVSNTLKFVGNRVIRADLFNDRGVHICKAMYALKYLSDKKKPDEKSDHFVGDLYVLFNRKAKENPELENKALEILQKWEAGDKEIIALWKKIDFWAVKGIKETDKIFGNKFDVYFRESEFYKKAHPVINKAIKKGFVKEKEEGFVAELEPEFPNKVILRKDGTSIYITNDIALTPHKFRKYKLDKSYWVVGNEQNLYFQQLFKIFEKIGFLWVKKCKHISYGMVNLPEGRMKSREGKVVDADDLINRMRDLARKELEERYKLDKKELEERSLKIAIASIKYMLLKTDMAKDVVFNPEEAMSFEGNTGPYLQYSYARASSILRKVKKKSEKIEIERLEDAEIKLIKKLGNFPEIVSQAREQLNPSIIANYSFELAQQFNEFYHSSWVIGSEKENFRLALVSAFRIVLKSSLYLLGIEVMEEM